MTNYEDLKIDVRLKLAGLWTSIMFLYVYADLLGFMQAKAVGQLLDKNLGPFGPITQGALLAIAIMLAIPTSMIFLSLVLRASYARWTNIVVGAMQALIAIGTFLMLRSWLHYRFFEILEAAFCIWVVWLAWKWPRAATLGVRQQSPA